MQQGLVIDLVVEVQHVAVEVAADRAALDRPGKDHHLHEREHRREVLDHRPDVLAQATGHVAVRAVRQGRQLVGHQPALYTGAPEAGPRLVAATEQVGRGRVQLGQRHGQAGGRRRVEVVDQRLPDLQHVTRDLRDAAQGVLHPHAGVLGEHTRIVLRGEVQGLGEGEEVVHDVVLRGVGHAAFAARQQPAGTGGGSASGRRPVSM